jgi:exonuclease III
MKIINWNISWLNGIENKAEYLKDLVISDSFIIILQEVKQNSYEYLKEVFNDCNIEYSLNYRVPGRYDNDSRKLGVAIITSKDIQILYANTLNRTLMPDRTLFLELEYNNPVSDFHEPVILGVHASVLRIFTSACIEHIPNNATKNIKYLFIRYN